MHQLTPIEATMGCAALRTASFGCCWGREATNRIPVTPMFKQASGARKKSVVA